MIRVPAVGLGVTRFFSWWRSQLAGAVSDIANWALPGLRRQLTAFVSKDTLRLVEGSSAEASPLLSCARAVHGPFEKMPPARVSIVFDPDIAFVQLLQMPIAALPHLDGAIALQLPKLLPMEPHALRTDFVVDSIDTDAGVVTVRIAALKASDVEEAEQIIKSLGMTAASIQVRGTESTASLHLSSHRMIHSQHDLSRWDFRLLVSAAVLSVVALLIVCVEGYRADHELARAINLVGPKAAAVLERRQHLFEQLQTLQNISVSEHNPTAAAILSEVSTRIGHENWVMSFELKGYELRLIGFSQDPATVVAGLSGSTLLTNVALHSSMSTGGQQKARERFEVTATVRPRA